jgi:acyl-CoA synthetase (AMP-forming)/AMP-acid ligase II
MTHPFIFARLSPDKPAVIMSGSGERHSFAQLEERANRTAHLLRANGIERGDTVAAMLPNGTAMFDIASAAERAGLYFTAISTHLIAEEAEYILRDSGAKALFTSPCVAAADVLAARASDVPMFMINPANARFHDWRAEADRLPTTPIADEAPGSTLLYSSGTTGRPKGVRRPMPDSDIMVMPFVASLFVDVYGAERNGVYLCPAPLYHAAPLAWSMMAHRLGMTVVVMEKFDAEEALQAIERHGVTIGQFVPTHFSRMLKLPEQTRRQYNLSSLKSVFHAAAPCPVPVKQAMLDWLGPIVHEYYSGTEGVGITTIDPHEWLRKPGSVGRARGCEVLACDEAGEPLPQGATGQIFFKGGSSFEYLNDAEKTAGSRNRYGWTTLGDVGHVDTDGYLFLTDRKSFMIISGGVNIYPQEIENLLITHPKVFDAAVIGAPDPDMGEQVVAIIQPVDPNAAGPALAEELSDYCREHLSGVKRPRRIDFIGDIPRSAAGKLMKRDLQARYPSAA